MKNNYYKPELTSQDTYEIIGRGKVKVVDTRKDWIKIVNQMLSHYMKEKIPVSIDNEDVLITGIERQATFGTEDTAVLLGLLIKTTEDETK